VSEEDEVLVGDEAQMLQAPVRGALCDDGVQHQATREVDELHLFHLAGLQADDLEHLDLITPYCYSGAQEREGTR
jgi:hypothetical protein